MKSKKMVPVLLILTALAVFVGYRQYDAIKSDVDAPEISINDTQTLQISVQTPKAELLQGVTAVDRHDGDVSDKLVVESMHLMDADGLIEVGYAVADKSGNVAKATRMVQYTDYESPKFSLSAPLIYEVYEDFDIMRSVFAQDVVDGDIQHRIRATALGEESIMSQGVHEVHFQVSNSLGDISEIILPVEVIETGTYAADLTLTDYLVYLPQGAVFRPEAYLDEFIYRAESTSLRNGLPHNFFIEVTGAVQTQTPGVYHIEYLVTRVVQHATNPELDQMYSGYSKLIVVVEG